MLYCLMNSSGKPFSQDVGRALVAAARTMHRKEKRRHAIKSPHCTGTIYTSFKSGSIGTISGTEFTAEVVVAGGETTITFLVRSFDLAPDAEWVPHQSLDAAMVDIAAREMAEHARSGRRLN